MEYLNVNIETAEELLTMDVENGKSPLRIVDPYKAFVQLCSEFPNQKEMARKTSFFPFLLDHVQILCMIKIYFHLLIYI